MKLSARNQLAGTISQLKRGPINTEVTLKLPGGQEIVSLVTNTSADNLELVEGKPAYAIIKASSVILNTDPIRTSARNNLCGKVSACNVGPVNAEVIIDLPGGDTRITAVITHESVDSLGLSEGKSACAMIKASSVILGVDA